MNIEKINRELLATAKALYALAEQYDKAQRGSHQQHWVLRDAKAVIEKAEKES